MARKTNVHTLMQRSMRESARQSAAAEKARERQYKAQIRERDRIERETAKLARLEEKEAARRYVLDREAEVTDLNDELQDTIESLEKLLADGLDAAGPVKFDSLKRKYEIPVFRGVDRSRELSAPNYWEPPKPGALERLMPGTAKKHEAAVAQAKREYEEKLARHNARVLELRNQFDVERVLHERKVTEHKHEVDNHNQQIDQFRADLTDEKPQAIIEYFSLVLAASEYPSGFPKAFRVAYIPESKQLVAEYELPPFEIAPDVKSYKYIKVRDEIASTPASAASRRTLYSGVVAQVPLRTIHELFQADRFNFVETIVFNGLVDSIDKATGKKIRPCVITVRTTKDTFAPLDLRNVEPSKCLKYLSASVSASPDELAPVKPVLEFNMVDPRFVEEVDVLSDLDSRPNLMELTPSEFESLITNLFEKMGLETRLTQASRDGGVDCVAYDPRPIFGGKVVIQAKRYKNTVGVSAVRDLFGTLQNEGASKGILVTTSGFGKAAFEFASGKPMELLSGANLLYLLEEHAGIKAKIEVPDAWKDSSPDNGTE